jgi:hypothetical protein
MAHQKTEHLPPMGGNTSELTFHGCYPFEITYPTEDGTGIYDLFKYFVTQSK